MYFYVEFLRATRALRIVAVVSAFVLVVGIVFWLGVKHELSNNQLQYETWAAKLASSPTAHVAKTKLPDGGTRTVIDDPKRRVHAVMERHGDSVTMDFTALAAAAPRSKDRPNGHITTATRTTENTRHVSHVHGVNFGDGMNDWGLLFSMTIPMGLLVATLLAGPLAKENNGHLELAWTKPVSREAYATTAILVDSLAIAVAQVAMLVTILIASLVLGKPTFSFEPGAATLIAFTFVAPIAWYACLTALSASMKRGPGAIIGAGWVVAIVAPWIMGSTQGSDWAVARVMHGISRALSYIDPITYIWFQNTDSAVNLARSTVPASFAVAVLAIVYAAFAVLQWRRVEA